jgi:hypothetical protein
VGACWLFFGLDWFVSKRFFIEKRVARVGVLFRPAHGFAKRVKKFTFNCFFRRDLLRLVVFKKKSLLLNFPSSCPSTCCVVKSVRAKMPAVGTEAVTYQMNGLLRRYVFM